jgi:hypothetical protein
MLWLYEKHLSGVVSNLEPIPQCYGFMITSFDHLSIYATKRERKLLMSTKQNENLNKQNLSFLINKTTKEKLQQKQLFELFYFFANRNK